MRTPSCPHFRPLVPLALSVAAGIWLADAGSIRPGLSWMGAVLLFLPVLAAGKMNPALRILGCLPWLLIGVEVQARRQFLDPRLDIGRHASDIGRLVEVRGILVKTPVGGGRGSYEMEVTGAGLPWRPQAGRVCMYLPCRVRDDPRYGDSVEVVGRLKPLRGVRNPGGWDAARMLGRQGFRARLQVGAGGSLVLAASLTPMHPLRILEDLRGALGVWADRNLGTDQAGLFRALLLGDRRQVPPRLEENFRRGGILHFLAISGLHVALVAGGLHRLLRALGLARGLAAAMVVAVLVVYTGIAGFRTPVVRAAILAGGVFVAPSLMRAADPWNLMAGAAMILLLLRPADLFSPGFGLSYGAVAGILVFAGCVNPASRIQEVPGDSFLVRRGKQVLRLLLGSVMVTTGAWLGSGPLIWEVFGTVHPWVPLANLLVMPVFLVTLISALLAAVTAPLGSVAAFLPLEAFQITFVALDGVGAFTAGLPFTSITTCPVGAGVLGICYLILLLVRFKPVLAVLIPALLVVSSLMGNPESVVPEVTVLDVGQGLSVFARAGPGRSWLYDAGSTDISDVSDRVIAPFLRHRGVRRCAAFFLSHLDQDHMSGAAVLIRNGWFTRVYGALPQGSLGCGVLETLVAGHEEGSGSWQWQVLHPQKGGRAYMDRNDGSMVVLLEIQGVRVVLPGDVEEAGLARLIRCLEGPVDILVLPHHGSHAWNLRDFLQAALPRVALISARKGFPDPRTIRILEEMGIPAFSTWKYGALTVTWNTHWIFVQPHLCGRIRISRFR